MQETEINEIPLEARCWQILRFFIMWSGFYLLIHNVLKSDKNFKINLDVKNRIVSICHGSLSFLFSLYFIYLNGINFEHEIDQFSVQIVALSLGYFVYDLIACLYFGLWDSKLIIHHALAMAGFGYSLLSGNGIFAGVLGLALGESSNFPMHLRSICKEIGLRHTKLYETADLMYLGIYILFRGIFSPVLCTMCFFSKSTPWMVWFVFFGLTLQSMFFIRIMLKILSVKRVQARERMEKNIQLFWFVSNPEVLKLEYVQKKSKQKVF